jgi:hypothetical protein
MAYLGIMDTGAGSAVSGVLGQVLGFFGLDDPFSPHRLVSITYNRNSLTSGAVTFTNINDTSDDLDGHHANSEKTFHTNSIRDQWYTSDSLFCKTMEQLDNGYMGCKPGQETDPTTSSSGPFPCSYSSNHVCGD